MRGRRHKLQVSTFPFLAVLLCAMGSLILVLLVMDRKAHKAARERATHEAARLVEESARNESDRRAEVERERQQLRAAWEKKRDELHAKLSDEQIEMQLQMRKVRDQLSEIAARLRYEQDTSTQLRHKVQDERGKIQAEQQLLLGLRSGAGQATTQSKESNKTLQRMTLDLLRMEQALKDLKAAKQREQHTFSVVPYHGRRGENRRPIYVECIRTAVIFHPERRAMPVTGREFLLGRDQFGAPPDDVRAEVERRIARQRAKPGAAGTTPYLLLLVRPDGVNTYHEFQAVLKGLPLDFGYEFIDADWVLDFPADDEQPNAQPWMAASKTPTAPASPSAPARNASTARPVAMLPSAGPGPSGIRTSEGSGSGRWSFRGPAGSVGSSAGGAASGASGSGPLVLGGLPGGTGSSASPGGIGSGPSGGTGFGQAGTTGGSSSGSSGLLGQGGGGGNGLASGGNPWGSSRGGGRGHPSALAPSLGEGQGGSGGLGEGGSLGNGRPGARGDMPRGATGPYVLGATLSGLPAPAGSEPASLGPPQALSPGGSVIASSGSGVSGAPGTGYPGGNGGAVRGTNLSGNGGSGFSGGASPGGGVAGSPGGNLTGPGGTGAGASSSGVAGRGMAGTGIAGTGIAGNGASSGSSLGTSIPPGVAPEGRYAVARGSGGGSGQPGLPGGTPSITARQGVERIDGGSSGSPGGSPPVSSSTIGNGIGNENGKAGSGGPPSSARPADYGLRTTDSSAVYPGIDPLMPRRPRGLPPANRPDEDAPPERRDEDAPPGAPRKKILVPGGGIGEPGGASAGAPNRYATPSYQPARTRKPAAMRPAWVHGGRDWTIYVECLNDGVKLYPSEKAFPLALAARAGSDNPLVTAIRQMIDRRQSARRPGDPPYYPQVRLLVRPENVRTFLTVYPALEALPVPKTRQNLDSDDDVGDIVTGANP